MATHSRKGAHHRLKYWLLHCPTGGELEEWADKGSDSCPHAMVASVPRRHCGATPDGTGVGFLSQETYRIFKPVPVEWTVDLRPLPPWGEKSGFFLFPLNTASVFLGVQFFLHTSEWICQFFDDQNPVTHKFFTGVLNRNMGEGLLAHAWMTQKCLCYGKRHPAWKSRPLTGDDSGNCSPWGLCTA